MTFVPLFERSKQDGDGNDVALKIMPRVDFGPPLGAQIGFRLETSREGHPLMEQTLGLNDWDRWALIRALTDAGPKP